MNTTERNWSAICDYEGLNFGQRAFYTRKDWIQQCIDWSYDRIDDEEDEKSYEEHLNEMEDWELMDYIQDTWHIEIRETTWLKVGNDCYWIDPEGKTSGNYTILDIRLGEDGELAYDTILLITDGWGENEVFFGECYGLTEETCPRCGSPLYVSDLCRHDFVCLKCDENFC